MAASPLCVLQIIRCSIGPQSCWLLRFDLLGRCLLAGQLQLHSIIHLTPYLFIHDFLNGCFAFVCSANNSLFYWAAVVLVASVRSTGPLLASRSAPTAFDHTPHALFVYP